MNRKDLTLKSISPDASSDPLISERMSGDPSPPNSLVSKTIPMAIPATEDLIGTPASKSAKQPPQTDAILTNILNEIALETVQNFNNRSCKGTENVVDGERLGLCHKKYFMIMEYNQRPKLT